MDNHTYNYDEQQPFAAAEFAENPAPRCPCVLLLDTSGSMEGDSIDELNRGVHAFREEIFNDSLSLKRVEIAVGTFVPVEFCRISRPSTDFVRRVSKPQATRRSLRPSRAG